MSATTQARAAYVVPASLYPAVFWVLTDGVRLGSIGNDESSGREHRALVAVARRGRSDTLCRLGNGSRDFISGALGGRDVCCSRLRVLMLIRICAFSGAVAKLSPAQVYKLRVFRRFIVASVGGWGTGFEDHAISIVRRNFLNDFSCTHACEVREVQINVAGVPLTLLQLLAGEVLQRVPLGKCLTQRLGVVALVLSALEQVLEAVRLVAAGFLLALPFVVDTADRKLVAHTGTITRHAIKNATAAMPVRKRAVLMLLHRKCRGASHDARDR